MFTFVHAADIHLDSPFLGLESYDGAPVDAIRGATRRAFENLVQLALDEPVAFVLIAGDLYDGDWRDYNTGLFLTSQLARLREANIPVIVIAGNHDAKNKMTKTLRLPNNTVLLSSKEPETKLLEDLGVAIHGQSYPTAAVMDDLSAKYPAALKDLFNIGLLHTCANGREGHERYSPCEVEQLVRRGYNYWALGHIHKREELSTKPPIIFSGNTQGRHAGEGERGPKGCMLVTVDDRGCARADFRALDVVRWEICHVKAQEDDDADAVLNRAEDELQALKQSADGRYLAVRVELTGRCRAHQELGANPHKWTNELRNRAVDMGGIWLEKIKCATAPPGVPRRGTADDALTELLEMFQQLSAGEAGLQQLREQLADLEKKLPPESLEGPDPLRFGDPVWFRELVTETEALLAGRLLDGGPRP